LFGFGLSIFGGSDIGTYVYSGSRSYGQVIYGQLGIVDSVADEPIALLVVPSYLLQFLQACRDGIIIVFLLKYDGKNFYVVGFNSCRTAVSAQIKEPSHPRNVHPANKFSQKIAVSL
jgi:hypothetical protein